MSLLLGCISWLSLSQHTSSCLYSTGDMQSYEDWILHKKHKAISLQHCKCLSELTSWCVDCVFYRGNNISIFLVSHWKVTEWVSLQNSIIAKPLRGMCALWPYIKKREKRKRRVIFFNRSAKTSCVRCTEICLFYSASNWLWLFGPWENFSHLSISYLNN